MERARHITCRRTTQLTASFTWHSSSQPSAMYFAQASTLPPLSNDDSASFLTACCSPSPQSPYRGDEPNTAPSHRLFEAKSLSLHSRPKTSLGMSRSARGFPPSLSTSSLSAWQAAPRQARQWTCDVRTPVRVRNLNTLHRRPTPYGRRWQP